MTSFDNRQLSALYALARELLHLEDPDELLDAIAAHAMEILRAERGFLVLLRDKEVEFKVLRNWSREELESGRETVSRTILSEVLRTGKPLLVEDALRDERFGDRQSVLGLQLRSVLAAPLNVQERTAGALYLECSVPDDLFGPKQLELFTEILELSSRALERSLQRLLLEERNQLLERDLLARYDFAGIVTRDPGFLRILETVAQVAATELNVLIQGPSGTGKELIARALHLNSSRSRGPYVTVNCGAIPPTLLESELFGHTRGSFTGATRAKTGLLRTAANGTVFLDEVGELAKDLQVKLLRVLQFGEVLPVGSTEPVTVDVRFVAATNRELEKEVHTGGFREDLYFRLNAITLQLPPLQKRPDDVLLLFDHFLAESAEKMNREKPELTPRVERMLLGYSWPGNVRELENEARRLVALAPPGQPVTAERLSQRIQSELKPALPDRKRVLAEHEIELIELHLRRAGGVRTRAAKTLGLSREGLRKKMKRLGMS